MKTHNTMIGQFLVEQIKNHLEKFGSFTTAEVEADSSPIAPYKGSLVQLIETFFENGGQVVVYDRNDNEIDSYEVPYEDVEVEQLEHILRLCDDHKEILIGQFLEDFADEVYEMPFHALELLMDDHKTIDYQGQHYFVAENNSMYDDVDENILGYLFEKHLY